MAKDHKQVMNSLTGATNAAKKKLADKFHAIEDLNAKYQQVGCVSTEPFIPACAGLSIISIM